jgi:hypothetical protein
MAASPSGGDRVKFAIALMVAVSLVVTAIPAASQEVADLEKGVRQVEGGEFEDAVITLDAAARRLALEGRRPKDLARAYTYLAIAYLQMSQEQAAKAKFLEALQADKDLRLDPKQLPPKVIQFFQDAEREAKAGATSAPAPPASPAPSTSAPTTATTTTGGKGKSSKTVPIVIGVGAAAAGVGVLVAAGGKDSVTTPSTTLAPATTTLSQLSASVTSAQRSTNIVCTQNVIAVVTLTNRGPSNVSISGVRHENRVVSANCFAAQPFTFSPAATLVGASQTVTVLNATLYANGSGCCNPNSSCNGSSFCEFTSVFTVLTSLGEVPAGGFNYGITFNRCAACTDAVGASNSCSERPE